jgi:hypothetical protein
MQATTTIGLDIAKSLFQVHGVDAAGQVVMARVCAVMENSCHLDNRKAAGGETLSQLRDGRRMVSIFTEKFFTRLKSSIS